MKTRRRHPISTGGMSAMLAVRSLFWLLLLYLGLLFVLGALFGGLQMLMTGGPRGLREWIALSEVSFSQLIDSPADLEAAATADRAVTTLTAIVSTLLPPLFFGAVVFKILHSHSRLRFRNRISLCRRSHGDFLFVRFYNSSRLLLVDLKLTAVVRIWNHEDGSDVLHNRLLRIENPQWPYAMTHMPFTLKIPLDPGDVVHRRRRLLAPSRVRLVRVQGHRLRSPEDCLTVIVRGDVPQIGRGFVEKHDYLLAKDLQVGDYAHIHPRLGRASRRWEGWRDFDAR